MVLALICFVSLKFSLAKACSNLLVPAGSSDDGSTIIAYNNDFSESHGALSHWVGGHHEPGELRPVHDWDTCTYLGAIPQTPQTYTVVGNTNEHQLTIGETTFGGLEFLDASRGRAVCHEKYGCLDYNQLIVVTLSRAKTAREAITVADELMQTYGYASSGESFSIADTSEVWHMEIMGKGNISKGSVWVATRIPDGSVGAHANQARTREFQINKPDEFRYSADVVSFARSIGLYHGSDEDFSFSDIYDPVSFFSARACEARVFSFFLSVAAAEERIEKYLDYAQGRNLTNRMPLYVRVGHKISVNETMQHMRSHYEGTWFDPTKDVGAGAFGSPYRLHSVGSYKGAQYINERPIGIPYTAWNFVATQRPNHKYGVLWFGVDDSTFTLRAPFYGVSKKVPTAWDDDNCTSCDTCREQRGLPGTVRKFSFRSMFWVTSMVANYAYSRYDEVAPMVFQRLQEIQNRLFRAVAEQDKKLDSMSDKSAEDAASEFSFSTAEGLHNEWLDFYGELFSTYVDGLKTLPDPTNRACKCKKDGRDYTDFWKNEIVSQAGEKYKVPASHEASPYKNTDKMRLRSFAGMRQNCPEDLEATVV